MIKNIGTKDRVARLVIGIVSLAGAYVMRPVFVQVILVAFGLFCIFQATFSWCAWYALLGKNTCPVDK